MRVSVKCILTLLRQGNAVRIVAGVPPDGELVETVISHFHRDEILIVVRASKLDLMEDHWNCRSTLAIGGVEIPEMVPAVLETIRQD